MKMSKRKEAILLSFFLGLFLVGSLFYGSEEEGETLVIKGAKIYTSGVRGVLAEASLLIEGGKIKKIIQGGDLPPGTVVDYSGKCIAPGLVDAHTYVSAYYRLLENSRAVTSDVGAFAAFDPLSPEVRAALAEGITSVNLSPRNENLVGGMTSVFKLRTDSLGLPFLKKEGFLKVSFCKTMERDDRPPISLMGAEEILNEWMQRAGRNEARTDIFGEEGIAKLAKGELQPLIAASNFEEINTALKWLADWKKGGVIVGGEEASSLSDELKKYNVPVFLSPLLFSVPDRVSRNAILLMRRGVKIAFGSDMPEGEASGLRTSALLLFHQGISQDEALKTITLYPAQILGVADSVGSLEEGKDADFIVFSGEPLDLSANVVAVYSNGRLVHKQN